MIIKDRKPPCILNEGDINDGKMPINAETEPQSNPDASRKIFSNKTNCKILFFLKPRAL